LVVCIDFVLIYATIMTGTSLSKWVNQIAKQPVLVPTFDTFIKKRTKKYNFMSLLFMHFQIYALSLIFLFIC